MMTEDVVCVVDFALVAVDFVLWAAIEDIARGPPWSKQHLLLIYEEIYEEASIIMMKYLVRLMMDLCTVWGLIR